MASPSARESSLKMNGAGRVRLRTAGRRAEGSDRAKGSAGGRLRIRRQIVALSGAAPPERAMTDLSPTSSVSRLRRISATRRFALVSRLEHRRQDPVWLSLICPQEVVPEVVRFACQDLGLDPAADRRTGLHVRVVECSLALGQRVERRV
jgi:hypothetical protein